ncbi:MAG: hypothetical protein ABR498_06735 [Candidatus Dormibacteria bacterium]
MTGNFSDQPGAPQPPDSPYLPPGWGTGYDPDSVPGAPPPPPPLSDGPAPRRRILLIALLAGVVIVVAGVGVPLAILNRSSPTAPVGPPRSAPSRGPSPSGGAVDAHAKALYDQALAAMRAASGCHYVAMTAGPGGSQQIEGDAGKNDGTQQITLTSRYGAEQFTLVLVDGGVVFFQGNGAALQDQLGVAAARAADLNGKWVSLSMGDGPYDVVAPGITVADQATETELVPTGSHSATAPDGSAATRLDGNVPATAEAPGGMARLDIAQSTQLPITYVSTVSGSGISITSTTTFSKWGTAPSVTAPTGAVAWSTLGASEPPGGYGSGGFGAGPGGSPTPGTF